MVRAIIGVVLLWAVIWSYEHGYDATVARIGDAVRIFRMHAGI